MPKYLIMPEGAAWFTSERPVKELEQVYNMEGHWFAPSTRIAIMNEQTKETKIFTRQLDAAGNLLKVIEV